MKNKIEFDEKMCKHKRRVIGQKVLIKTAVAIEISMAMAVLSCF